MSPTAEDEASPSSSRRATLVSFVLVSLLAAFTTVTRVRVTLADPNFDAHEPAGLLKSDPALLYYLTERVIESDGALPDDFRADPRVEHPEGQDVVRTLPVAQEFGVAWLRLLCGDALPLHVFCLWVAGACASLALIGAWLLARELCGDAWLALLAAALAAALPAAWRTTGFVLMDEDFSLPFLALHLGLLARAARVRTAWAGILSALALFAALATWHATQFLFALELAALLAAAARHGFGDTSADRAHAERTAWFHAAALCVAGLFVPFLRASGFALSLPVAATFALAVAARSARRGPGDDARAAGPRARPGPRVVLLGGLILFGALATLGRHVIGADAYDHVFALMTAKLRHLGDLPADPRELTPEVRLMWQGPFATLTARELWTQLGLALLALPAAVVALLHARRATDDGRRADGGSMLTAAALLVVLATVASWAVQRVVVLPALVAPAVIAAVAHQRFGLTRARVALALLVAVQAVLCAAWLAQYSNPWYASPRQRQAEIRAMVEALPRLVPDGAAVAADSMNASAILVHTRRPGILSPKWESAASRARVVEFLQAFAHETPERFRARIVERFRCRYLLVDRFTLGYLSAYAAGFTPGAPPPGTAAAALLSTDDQVLGSLPGYRLLYRSPTSIRQSNGAPTDFYRLYELTP